jgi:hypothetical protein
MPQSLPNGRPQFTATAGLKTAAAPATEFLNVGLPFPTNGWWLCQLLIAAEAAGDFDWSTGQDEIIHLPTGGGIVEYIATELFGSGGGLLLYNLTNKAAFAAGIRATAILNAWFQSK